MEVKFETDHFPVIKARFFRAVTERRKVRVIVIHSMEVAEKDDTAERVAKAFKNSDRKASAHLCIDSDSIVQCVFDNDVAFAAPGANHDGMHLELAGFARQTRAEWLDPFGVLLLDNAANAAAQYCLKYSIPIKHLTNAELGDKKSKGLVGHVQVTDVFKLGTHTDPGAGFPWDHFLTRVAHFQAERRAMFAKM